MLRATARGAWAAVCGRAARVWRPIATVGERHPVVFGCTLTCAKTCLTDLMVQTQVEGRSWADINWRRNACLSLFGFAYLGGVQYFIYVPLFTRRLFPQAAAFAAKSFRAKLADRTGQAAVLKQVFLDQFVHHPLLLFPTFYALKAVINGDSARDGLRHYLANARQDLPACWSVWVPAFLINFSVCPMWARIPFVSLVSVGWISYWSFMRGEAETPAQQPAAEPAAAT